MSTCGIGGWGGPIAGDPSNNSILTASPAFGGIDVRWNLPAVNPHAVSYVELYRGLTSNFSSAILLAEAGGGHYYDKIETVTQYYYWIKIVSVHGTIGSEIGPATAVSRPAIAEVIEQLTGQIDEGMLAIALKADLAKIGDNYSELQQEILDRIAGQTTLSLAISDVDDVAQQTLAYIGEEITTRAAGDDALALQIGTIASLNDTTAARVEEVRLALIAEDTALGLRIDEIDVAGPGVTAAVNDVAAAKIGYSAKNDTFLTPYDGDGVTIVYPATTYPSGSYPAYAVDRTRIIDAQGVTNWNTTPAGTTTPLIWVVGMPLASTIRQVEVTGPDGTTASLASSMSAQADLNGDFKALYTVKLNVDGLAGGFGIFNDGVTVEAGFDVDKFWVGRTSGDKRKPFIISGGEVFIDQAVIEKLTFTKLTDASGSFVVADGKVKTDYIETKGLSIRDTAGNIILNAGSGTFLGNVTGNVGGVSAATLVSNASTALANANTALTTANTAQTNANAAIGVVDAMVSDSTLSPMEKQSIQGEFDKLVLEKPGINSQASTFSVTTENTAYNNAFLLLERYLTGTEALFNAAGSVSAGTNFLANLTSSSTLDKTYASLSGGPAMRKIVADFYAARQALLNRISLNAKTIADAAQVAADTANASVGIAAAAATTAQTAATNAQNSAAAAATAVADMASDSKLSPIEKQAVKREWDTLGAEKGGINSQASIFSATTENTTYNNAYSLLDAYLNSTNFTSNILGSVSAGSSLLGDLSTTTDLDKTYTAGSSYTLGAGFRKVVSDFYTARQALLNKISLNAKIAADQAATTAGTAASTANTAVNTANSAASTAGTALSTANSADTTANSAVSSANAALSGLNTRLRTDAQNVLAGPGGLSTGSLSWDSQGVRTGGFGVGLSRNGIVAYNSFGSPTFVLDGNSGNATFSGNLSAATGTFAGTLTAGAINAVNTINIAGQAVSITSSVVGTAASISTTVSVPFGESYTVIGIGFQNGSAQSSGGPGGAIPLTVDFSIVTPVGTATSTIGATVLRTEIVGDTDEIVWGRPSGSVGGAITLTGGIHTITLNGIAGFTKTLVLLVSKR